ncbi:MAG: hypothetical protein JSU77_00670 [Fidelibacterota bacterium]|nr:MAG: hypothetical protein JSU77_00670 [Candidatus Neomarinimicrobiota bacterium]
MRTSKGITERVYLAYLDLLRNGDLIRIKRYCSDHSSRLASESGTNSKRELRRL